MANKKENLLMEIKSLKKEIKQLKSRKKYGLVWEDKDEQVVLDCKNKLPVLIEEKKKQIFTDKNNPVNVLIEGDNYHALSVLNYTHKGKVDVIYIDPPYNTGARDWKYNNDYVDINDGYRHSKWISMMNNRLMLAKKLLKKDGVLICTIDENERARIELLLEELFPNHQITSISIVHNPQGIQGNNFSYTHEYALFVVPKVKNRISEIEVEERQEIFRDDTGNSYLRTNAKNCFYPVFVKKGKIIGFGDVPPDSWNPKDRVVKKKEFIEIWPIRDGVERKWRYARQSVGKIKNDLFTKETKRGIDIFQIKKRGKPKTVWIDPRYHAGGKYGTKLINEIIGRGSFNYPKSLFSVIQTLKITTRKSSIVLDFFAGSGTTGHAVLNLNKEDGGNRKFILCTNNENKIATKVCYPRIKKVIEGYKSNKGKVDGLGGNLKYYKTDFIKSGSINHISDESKIRLTHKAGEMIAIREEVLDEQEKNEWWQIFSNEKKKIAIYFEEDKSKLQELVKKLSEEESVVLYIFSWGKNEYKNEFLEYKNIRVEDIPEPIIEVYKALNKI